MAQSLVLLLEKGAYKGFVSDYKFSWLLDGASAGEDQSLFNHFLKKTYPNPYPNLKIKDIPPLEGSSIFERGRVLITRAEADASLVEPFPEGSVGEASATGSSFQFGSTSSNSPPLARSLSPNHWWMWPDHLSRAQSHYCGFICPPFPTTGSVNTPPLSRFGRLLPRAT